MLMHFSLSVSLSPTNFGSHTWHFTFTFINLFSIYYNKLLKDLIIIIIYIYIVIVINPRKMNAGKIYKEKVIEMEE